MKTLVEERESLDEIVANATAILTATLDSREARLQAELLLAHTIRVSRAMLFARLNETVSTEVAAQYADYVDRRAGGEPLAYVLGRCEFYGLDLAVDRRVLIPRHETESIVEIALKRMRRIPLPVIADVGTGSGAIALALAHHLPNARTFATDISHEALLVARSNAARLDLDHVRFVQGDLLTLLDESFDLIVANLPYIPSVRYDQLPREVRDYEPRVALDGGIGGLAVISRLLEQLKHRMAQKSILLLEISEEQGRVVMELVRSELPYAEAHVHQDLEGLDRVVEIQLDAS